jgi:hypothetical protein
MEYNSHPSLFLPSIFRHEASFAGSSACSRLGRGLCAEVAAFDSLLPTCPVEPIWIRFHNGRGSHIGNVDVSEGVPAALLALAPLHANRIARGRPAVFRLVLHDSTDNVVAGALPGIVAGMRVWVFAQLEHPENCSGTEAQLTGPLPFTCEHSTTDDGSGCIRISVPAPASSAPLMFFVLRVVTVGGSEVPLDAAHSVVTAGFEHAHASPGPLLQAAKTGDTATLRRLLQSGGSTEEVEASACEALVPCVRRAAGCPACSL